MSENDGQIAAMTTTVSAVPMLQPTRPWRWSHRVLENTDLNTAQPSWSS